MNDDNFNMRLQVLWAPFLRGTSSRESPSKCVVSAAYVCMYASAAGSEGY